MHVNKTRKIGFILSLLLVLFTTFSFSHTAFAGDDAKSMEDISAHYADAGAYWANSKDKSDYSEINGVGQNWNYFGSGSDANILSSGAKGMRTSTYSALWNYPVNGKPQSNHSLWVAARFSYAMKQSGLDHQYSGDVDWTVKPFRLIGSWITAVFLGATGIAQVAVILVLGLFQLINPFTALQTLVHNTGFTNDGIIGQLMKSAQLPELYNSLSNMTVAVAIFTFAVMVLLGLMGYNKGAGGYTTRGVGSNNKHGIVHAALGLLKRIFVVFMAPILIAALASDLTDILFSSATFQSAQGVKVIYSHYINFGDWAQKSRLALPSTTDAENNRLYTAGNTAFDSDYVLKINTDGAKDKNAINAAKSEANLDKSSTTTVEGKLKDQSQSQQAKSIVQNNIKATMDQIGGTWNWLIGTYGSSATINGTEWDARFKSSLLQKIKANSKLKDNDDYIKNPYKAISADKDSGYPFGQYGNDNYKGGAKLDFYKDYSLNYSDDGKGREGYYSDPPSQSKIADIGSSKGAGLSSIGLYNYLNTFSDGDGLTYTTPKTFLGLGTVNQHAQGGFVGRGFLFFGSYIEVLVILISISFMIFLILSIIAKGIIAGAPRIILYMVQLGTGSWKGFINVLKEMINIYARIVIGILIIQIFSGFLTDLDSTLERLIAGMTGIGATKDIGDSAVAMIHIGHASTQLAPFMVAPWILGFFRLVIAVLIFLACYVIAKSFNDILKFIDKAVERLMNLLSQTSVGSKLTPDSNKNDNPNMGMNRNEDKNNKNGKGGKDGKGNDLSNDPNSLYDRANDPMSNLADGDDEMRHGMRGALGEAALKGADKLANSKLAKGAAFVAGSLGAGSIGHAMGIKSRADGQRKVQDAMQKFKQHAAMVADPTHANDSLGAGVGENEKERLDATEEADKETAQQQIVDDAAKEGEEAQKAEEAAEADAKDVLDKVDEDGDLKDTDDAKELSDKLQAEGKGNEELQDSIKDYQGRAKNHANELQKNAKKAHADADANKQKMAKAKAAIAKAPNAQAKAAAEKEFDTLSKRQPILDRRAAKADFMTDPNKQAEFTSLTGKSVGATGQGIKAATDQQLTDAQNRLFTARTGMKASDANKATSAQMTQAAEAANQAQQVLQDHNATDAQKDAARQTLSDANTVLQTGQAYGQFATPQQSQSLQQATQADYTSVSQTQRMDQATVTTGMVATGSAVNAGASELRTANSIAQAKQIIQTGQISSGGHVVNATPKQIQHAQAIVASAGGKQIQTIQNSMMSTGLEVQQNANNYAQRQVQQFQEQTPNAQPAQLQQIRQQSLKQYYAEPQVQQQLQSAGLITQTIQQAQASDGSPQQVQQLVQQAQTQTMRAATLGTQHKDGLNRAIEPIRQNLQSAQERVHNFNQNYSPNNITAHASNEWGQMRAGNDLVTKQMYGKTTQSQVVKASEQLMKAYSSGNQRQISEARQYADNIGMNSTIASNLNNVRQTYQQLTGDRNNFAQKVRTNAFNHSGLQAQTEQLSKLDKQIQGKGFAKS